MKKISLAFILLYLSGCANFANRSFVKEMDEQNEDFFVAGRDFPVVPGDSGRAFRSRDEIMKRTPITGLSKREIRRERSLRNELQAKVEALKPREKAQYYRIKPYLKNTSERIYFLSLTRFERYDYIEAMGLGPKNGKKIEGIYSNSRSLASLDPLGRNGREIELGMDKEKVIRNWGKPSKVEVAGNPRQENERWTFFQNGSVRQVYFESGVVQGWTLP